MTLAGYSEYKQSGVEWLGQVPTHWEIRSISSVSTKITNGYVGPTRDVLVEDGVRYLQSLHIKRNRIRFDQPYFVRDEWSKIHAKSILKTNDVLIVQTGDIGQVAVVTEDFEGCNCHALIIVSPLARIIQGGWLSWVLNSHYGLHSLLAIQTGALHPHLNCGEVKYVSVPVPPIAEQTAIVAFLDRETAKIDALVDEQKRLIELLQEKRQAVISHAVTKGLDPNAPMKDSGVEWLGQVPSEWRVVPLKSLTAPGRDIMYGIVLPGPTVEVGVPIVKGGDVKPGRLKVDLLNRTTAEIEAPFARARLKPNDIVYSIRGTIGDAELVPAELCDANITQDVARISPSDEVDFRWLLYAVRSQPIFTQLEQRSLGAAVRGINIFDLKRARIPVPPRAIQAAIADYLEREVGKFDTMSDEAEKTIALLRERRSALISAAITGKIDVRGAVNIPAEAA